MSVLIVNMCPLDGCAPGGDRALGQGRRLPGGAANPGPLGARPHFPRRGVWLRIIARSIFFYHTSHVPHLCCRPLAPPGSGAPGPSAARSGAASPPARREGSGSGWGRKIRFHAGKRSDKGRAAPASPRMQSTKAPHGARWLGQEGRRGQGEGGALLQARSLTSSACRTFLFCSYTSFSLPSSPFRYRYSLRNRVLRLSIVAALLLPRGTTCSRCCLRDLLTLEQASERGL